MLIICRKRTQMSLMKKVRHKVHRNLKGENRIKDNSKNMKMKVSDEELIQFTNVVCQMKVSDEELIQFTNVVCHLLIFRITNNKLNIHRTSMKLM